MAENLPVLADSLFKAALLDAAMTAPDGTALFPAANIDVKLGGFGAINGASGSFTLPLPKPLIAIDSPQGLDSFFTLADPHDPAPQEVTLVELILNFTVFSNDGAADAATKQRLLFARDRRVAVFSAHGLTLLSACSDHLADYLVPEGLYQHHYTWHFFWGRSSGF